MGNMTTTTTKATNATERDRVHLLVYGYVRYQVEKKLTLQIPKGIIDIFVMYCRFWFEFDREQCGKHLIFKSTNRVIVSESNKENNRMPNIAISKDIISSRFCDVYEWELTLNAFGDKTPNIYIGWINKPVSENITKWYGPFTYLGCNNHNKNTFAVRIATRLETVDGGKFTPLTGDYDVKFEPGDKLKLIFNFVKAEVNVEYNGKFVNTAFTNIAKAIIPAVALCAIGTDVSVTDVNAYKL